MFTGIVRALGTVRSRSIRHGGDGCTLVVDLGALNDALGSAPAPIRIGDSIAVNGACLSVTELEERTGCATFAVSPETLARCLVGEWGAGDAVNLEPALTLQTPLGGHLLPGHVDGTGTVLARWERDAFTRMQIEATGELRRLIAAKGAIAVDGVSLTVNEVSDHAPEARTRFAVMLVPHTLKTTTLGALQAGARVHLEADPVARYVQRLLESARAE